MVHTAVHHMNSVARESTSSSKKISRPNIQRLVDKVLPFEESSKVEDLPYAKACEREQCEPCKVLNAGVG